MITNYISFKELDVLYCRLETKTKKQHEEELKEIKEKYKVLDDILDKLDQPKLEALLRK